ncbi:MAG: metallophosphoesterase family protein [Dehalococcoidales bacterium]|jgi:diadenosine tetraphosphatase ApaH/serine/threonine PP2A family protein phosphatase|nr:metallophosphoesterase family protein [Dehalococcoidales bacterium]
MRYAIVSDIHANLAAFSAVLDHIGHQGGVEKVWCLGDVIGYGPDPNECIEKLRQTDHVWVAGNHDLGAIGKISTNEFNPDAAASCHWTGRQLSSEDVEYIENLPLVIEEGDFTLAHGSPREPIWEYLVSNSIARENFSCFTSQFCLVGHSHVPLVFSHEEDGPYSAGRFSDNVKLILGTSRLIINPGAVGQSRDGDPQASYALYDSQIGIMKLYRVPYDIRVTQDKMVERGLPTRQVARLSQGM